MNKYDPNGNSPLMVQVIHKAGDDGKLAVGTTFRFRSGTGYTVQADGSLRNADGKPARGKAYKKKLKKIQRAMREQQRDAAPTQPEVQS